MWNHYISKLQAGETIRFRPRGKSMTPRIHSGDLVTVKPYDGNISVGDVVLSKVRGTVYLHLVTALEGERVQISNNHGHINGWTNRSKVYGILISVES